MIRLEEPIDFALDPLLNAYILDADKGLLVFSPQGRLLGTIGGEELREPRAIALAPDGALLVLDDKTKQVLRYE